MYVGYTKYLYYNDVIMGTIASQITSLTIVYSTVYSDGDQRKHQSSVSLAFVRGIHRGPVNSPHKWPVTRKIFPFDDVIMAWQRVSAPLGLYSPGGKTSYHQISWSLKAVRSDVINDGIALKFDRHVDSSVSEVHAKRQCGWKSINQTIAVRRPSA